MKRTKLMLAAAVIAVCGLFTGCSTTKQVTATVRDVVRDIVAIGPTIVDDATAAIDAGSDLVERTRERIASTNAPAAK